MRVVVLVATVTACFSKPPPPSGNTTDGGHHDDAMTTDGSSRDAPPLCAQWGAFNQGMLIMVPGATGTGIQHVTISDDGLELVYNVSGSLYESVRTSNTLPFETMASVPGFPGSGAQPAWLSSNRLYLFYLDTTAMLIDVARTTIDDDFVTPGVDLVNGADDATATNDRLRVVFATNNTLRLMKFSSADNPAASMEGPLLDTANVGYNSPSIGDHGRKLVWTKTELGAPDRSILLEADFDGNQLTNQHDLFINTGAGDFDTDPSLSDDGTTLYFTSTRTAGDSSPQLYVATRTCN